MHANSAGQSAANRPGNPRQNGHPSERSDAGWLMPTGSQMVSLRITPPCSTGHGR
jgi:hypothetical protein